MKWRKLGLIIRPDNNNNVHMISHAMLPVADQISDDVYRIYFSGRDANNRSHICYAEKDLKKYDAPLTYSKEPVLSPGELGCFDDNGVTPSWIVNDGGEKILYYIGWKPRSTTRMSLVGGMAKSNDGGKRFVRVSKAPLFHLTNEEPFSLLTAPCVLKENNLWRMWYVSGVGWIHRDLPRYNIKYAESHDGWHWKRTGIVCIDFSSPEEYALARPSVLKEGSIYKMWFSFKGKNFRIGYAESENGISWARMDHKAGIDVSSDGWDSEMIEYSYVFKHNGVKYMLYNGNDYGRDGVGMAIEEKEG